jgi:hypothetical protein
MLWFRFKIKFLTIMGGWVAGWVAGWLAGTKVIRRLTQSSWAGAGTEHGKLNILNN